MLKINDFPILDFDEDSYSITEPEARKGFTIPERAVLLFMSDEVDDYAKEHNCEALGGFNCVIKKLTVYKAIVDGKEVAFLQAPLGGPAAVTVMEDIIGIGAKKIIACGCCGALEEEEEGDFYIPQVALRHEGTSYHYLPASKDITLDEEPILAIERALDKEGLSHKRCKTWTTDAYYRETKALIKQRKDEGCTVVEMECASLAACARHRGIQFGQLLFTSDSLANVEKYDVRNWGRDAFGASLVLALKSAAEL